MTKIPKYWNKAKKYLSKKDKIIAKLIKDYRSPSETILTSRRDIFFSLCKSIIGQQISVAAANAVFLKFKKKCNNKTIPLHKINITIFMIKASVLFKYTSKNIISKKATLKRVAFLHFLGFNN